MTQKQKDTIREEFRVTFPYLELNIKMEDWWLLMLEEAYQSGAKDKVEEVLTEVNSVEPSPNLDEYLKVVKEGDKDDMYDLGVRLERKKVLNLQSLKDNT